MAENSTFKQSEFNPALVPMQYFDYLRRNPDDPAEPGLNFDGYNFWLNKLNEFNIEDTIVANTVTGGGSGPDLSGSFNSQDYNLIKDISDASFTGTTTHNVTGVDPLLGPLAANGGPTLTHALLVGSPAIDAGNTALTIDQRGQPRPIDDQTVVNAASGNASDIGAYEAHNLEVNSTADTDDGTCRALGTSNGCTLREAINAANTEAGAD